MRTDCAFLRLALWANNPTQSRTDPWQRGRPFRNFKAHRQHSHGPAVISPLLFLHEVPASDPCDVFPMYFLMIQNNNFSLLSPVTMGKYRIAACPRPLSSGRFEAQVSIASGRGSATTDRVMRFCDDFSTHDAAAHYALSQGIDWVHSMTRPH